MCNAGEVSISPDPTPTAEPTSLHGLSDPRLSHWLMVATWVVGGLGYFLAFTSNEAENAVKPVAILSVGVVGIISMIRHSLFHRSDAIRMGWNSGERNNFQIETGFANLAIGLPAIAAVHFDWGTSAVAAFVLAYAIYFFQVAILVAIDRKNGKLNISRLAMMIAQTAFLGYFAISALHEAGMRPFD